MAPTDEPSPKPARSTSKPKQVDVRTMLQLDVRSSVPRSASPPSANPPAKPAAKPAAKLTAQLTAKKPPSKLDAASPVPFATKPVSKSTPLGFRKLDFVELRARDGAGAAAAGLGADAPLPGGGCSVTTPSTTKLDGFKPSPKFDLKRKREEGGIESKVAPAKRLLSADVSAGGALRLAFASRKRA